MPYWFRYRRIGSLFWIKEKVVGHKWEKDLDKMVLYFSDGSLKEIARWKDCNSQLRADFVIAQKKAMEAQTGQNIKLNVDI